MRLLPPFSVVFRLLSLFLYTCSPRAISEKTEEGVYTWINPPESGIVQHPPYDGAIPTILLSTYPTSGSTFIWKVWELARGIGALSVFREGGESLQDGTFAGSPHGGKLDRILRVQSHQVTNLTRKQIQGMIRSATPQEPVLVKNHSPIYNFKFKNKRLILGVISVLRGDVRMSCVRHHPQTICKYSLEKFQHYWELYCANHNLPYVVYPYRDLISTPFVVFRDMFDKFVPFEKIQNDNLTMAIQYAQMAHSHGERAL